MNFSVLREIKILMELKHTNLVELLDVQITEDGLELVLDFCDTDLKKVCVYVCVCVCICACCICFLSFSISCSPHVNTHTRIHTHTHTQVIEDRRLVKAIRYEDAKVCVCMCVYVCMCIYA